MNSKINVFVLILMFSQNVVAESDYTFRVLGNYNRMIVKPENNELGFSDQKILNGEVKKNTDYFGLKLQYLSKLKKKDWSIGLSTGIYQLLDVDSFYENDSSEVKTSRNEHVFHINALMSYTNPITKIYYLAGFSLNYVSYRISSSPRSKIPGLVFDGKLEEDTDTEIGVVLSVGYSIPILNSFKFPIMLRSNYLDRHGGIWSIGLNTGIEF